MIQNISLAQLRYVVALDTYRHFVTAAEHCFVTQPTLSMQIKKLEEELGIVLFDRSKQPIIPTAAGVAIIQQAREVLAAAQKITDLIQAIKNEIAGDFYVGIIPTVAPYLVPYFIGPFSRTYPAVQLHIIEMKTEEILHNLEKERIDAGILATPFSPLFFKTVPLFYEEFWCFLHEQDEAVHLPEVTTELLAQKRLWTLPEGNCFRTQLFNLCQVGQPHPPLNVHYESQSLTTLLQMVELEGGATLIPQLALRLVPAQKQHCLKPVVNEKKGTYVREISWCLKRHQNKQHILQALQHSILTNLPPAIQQQPTEKELIVKI